MTDKRGKSDGWRLAGTPVFADPQPVKGLTSEFVLDSDGAVSSFTIHRIPGYFRSDGRIVLTPAGSALSDPDPEHRLLGEPITATLLRRLKFSESVREAKQSSKEWETSGFGGGQPAVDHLSKLDAMLDRRRGAARLDDLYYATVAVAYVEAFDGGSTSPLVDLADRLLISHATARNHVREARLRGLLSPTVRGKGGGVLTAKALELLGGEAER